MRSPRKLSRSWSASATRKEQSGRCGWWGTSTPGSGAAPRRRFFWAEAQERAERFSPRLLSEVLIWRCWDIWWGTTPAEEGVRLCSEFMERSPSKKLEGIALIIRGAQKGALARLEEGREDIAAGRALLKDLGALSWWSGTSMVSAEMELQAGNAQIAYDTLAEGDEYLASTFETGYRSTMVGLRAQAALELGREDEALDFADETERIAAVDDFEPRCPPAAGARARPCEAR